MLAQLTWILSCCGLGLGLSVALVTLVGNVFGPLYESEADMSRNVVLFLAEALLLVVIGGFIGNRIYCIRKSGDNNSSS